MTTLKANWYEACGGAEGQTAYMERPYVPVLFGDGYCVTQYGDIVVPGARQQPFAGCVSEEHIRIAAERKKVQPSSPWGVQF